MGEEKVRKVRLGEVMLEDTGASYTRTFGIYVFFCIENNSVVPCPIHLHIIKGYRNERYYYQLVPVRDTAMLAVGGSGGVDGDLWDRLYIDARKASIVKMFIEAAERGAIREVWEDIKRRVPGRFCYCPPGEFIPVIHVEGISSIEDFFTLIEKMKYPALDPGWFEGGYVKAGKITPTRQGNLVGMSKVSAPVWARAKGRDVVKYVRTIEITGSEQHVHKITFEREVQAIEWRDISLMPDINRSALVFAATPTRFRIEHPQHSAVEGKFIGLAQFVHLRRVE